MLAAWHDFKPKPRYVRPAAGLATEAHPQFTSGVSGDHYVAPGDFAVIYDVNPLYTAGSTGTGQTIGIMGQTDIVMADITDFRAAAGLPVNNPTVFLIPGSADPGIGDASGDINEADLDLEWSGGVAKNAAVVFVNSTNIFDFLAIRNREQDQRHPASRFLVSAMAIASRVIDLGAADQPGSFVSTGECARADGDGRRRRRRRGRLR